VKLDCDPIAAVLATTNVVRMLAARAMGTDGRLRCSAYPTPNF